VLIVSAVAVESELLVLCVPELQAAITINNAAGIK
jgi:hypothetical protein